MATAKGTPKDPPPEAKAIVAWLRARGSEGARAGMARYGINVARAHGVSVATLRPLAKRLGPNPELADALWGTGVHEARLLAGLLADPATLRRSTMDAWTRDFDSWDLCDLCCIHCFRKTAHAWDKAFQYSRRRAEFVKRTGFSLMACLAVHDKAAPVERFRECLERVAAEAGDERNFVRKAVNWALRQIGKRGGMLHGEALALAETLATSADRSARWVGRDAARELRRHHA